MINPIQLIREADLLSRRWRGQRDVYGKLVKRYYQLVSTVALRLGQCDGWSAGLAITQR
jgi:hypothetical protein